MNEMHPELIETRSATLERVAGNVIELRFKPDVKLDVEGVTEVVIAKRRMCHNEEFDILVVFPPELDFELSVLGVAHDQAAGGCGLARRLALAANSTFNERLANIYFRYHPREQETAVFLEEADARKWLTEALPQPSLS